MHPLILFKFISSQVNKNTSRDVQLKVIDLPHTINTESLRLGGELDPRVNVFQLESERFLYLDFENTLISKSHSP